MARKLVPGGPKLLKYFNRLFESGADTLKIRMKIEQYHLSINPYSRSGKLLHEVKTIVMHWVGNAGSSAEANRNFFESRKDGRQGYGSAHYIVGIDGEVIECIPTSEAAWHVGSKSYTVYTRSYLTDGNPNYCTIGIEMCHPRSEGAFTYATLFAACELAGSICEEHHLNPYRDITTHKAIVGWKDCPKHWCENPWELQSFQRKVAGSMGL